MTMDQEDDREFLDPMIRELPRSIEPAHDLWPGIAGRLGARPQRRSRWSGAWRIAAAVALVALSSFMTWSLMRRAQVPSMHDEVATTSLEDIARYARASGDLAAALGSAPGLELAPETRALVQRNLAVIDSAIADIRRAIEADPANGELRDFLGGAERQRLELLQQAARLPRS